MTQINDSKEHRGETGIRDPWTSTTSKIDSKFVIA
jgi:hypothetical protein